MLTRRGFGACALCAALGLTATVAEAESGATSGITRKVLQRIEYPGDRYVTLLVSAVIAPGALVARHTHPGVESTYILEGGGTFAMQGQPDRPIMAGDSFQIPPLVPHAVRNGPATTRVATCYVVEKDKPLASPAPD